MTSARFDQERGARTHLLPNGPWGASHEWFLTSSSSRLPVCFAIVVLCVSLWGAVGQSAEPAEKFLQALRDRGYHDMAVEYLQRMKTSPAVSVELREIILYELGTTLIEASRTQRDVAIREKYLDDARDALKRFIGQNPDHELVSAANTQLGNLLVERAGIKVGQAAKEPERKTALLQEANAAYEEAYKVFVQAQEELKEKLLRLQNVSEDDKKAIALRDRLRADYLQAQLLAAAIREEASSTAPEGSDEQKKMLNEAAERYAEMAEKYQMLQAGLFARLYQGRCLLKAGKITEALKIFEELITKAEQADSRDLGTNSRLLALEGWQQSDPPQNAKIVEKLEPWIDSGRPNERETPDWLKMQLGLAKAQWAEAQRMKAANPSDNNVRRVETAARKNAVAVSRVTGDLQQEARELLASWGATSVDADQRPEPETFADAHQAGKDALEMMQTANLVLKTVPQRLARESDATVKADLQKQLQQAQQDVQSAIADAKRYFRMALKFADSEISVEEVNVVRYFLCFLEYTTENYLDAAVVGEFIARRYPDASGARQSAKIAMASYLKLYSANESEDKTFERDHIIGIASYITDKWSDQPEAAEALNTLIPFMIQSGNLELAEQYLNDIPEDSPKRSGAENKTGQALWSSYLAEMVKLRKWEREEEALPEGVDLEQQRAMLQDLRERAKRILQAGVNRTKSSGAIDAAAVAAALSLTQIYVETGETNEAIALLEDPAIGPLTLVQANSPHTTRAGFDAETYKTALQAYISSLASAADSDAVIKKAEGVMDAMRAAVPSDQLIGVYVGLARDLEDQVKEAPDSSKMALTKGFDTFLKRIRATSTDFNVLNWVAETYGSIAAGFDTGVQVTAEAVPYYQEAADTYEKILKELPPEDAKITTQLRLRLASTKTRLNKFTEARDLFVSILKENAMMLNVQIEAANLYQAWASFPGKEALYEKAMGGAEEDPSTKKNIIWGWGRIAQISARYPQFRDSFHQARYNLALCRYSQSQASGTPQADKKVLLEKAKTSILHTQKLYGTGDEWEAWRPRYDRLMKDIQKAMGEVPSGLPQDETPA